MKAVVYERKTDVRVQDVEDARIEQPTDVVVRITSTGICGSDLHMYEGRTEMQKGQVLGHENMGVIEQVGESVRVLKKGDRVVIKGISIGTGQCPVKRYNAYLRDLIVAGKARPSFIVSHRVDLDQAPDAYRRFDQRRDGYTKVILKPGGPPARA
jgi:threonine dehydrogenase-like Zn-dependent dehydrogenase